MADVAKEGLTRFSDALLRYSIRGKGKTIFHQGEPNDNFTVLCNGVVKIVKNVPGGTEVILEVLSAMSVVNVPPGNKNTRHPFSAVTISPLTEMAHIKKPDLFKLLDSYSRVGDNLCGQVSRRFVTAFNVLSAMQLGVKHRILTILSIFGAVWKAEHDDRYVKILLTQSELAQLIQTTPETISRTLRPLRDEGVVQVSPRGELFIAKLALRDYLNGEY